MILYLDTALSGKYQYRDPDHAPQQPHLTRLALMLWDERAAEPALEYCRLVEPRPGWHSDPEAIAASGVHPAIAAEQGQPLETVWQHFKQMRAEARLLVAFNWDHHRRVLLRTAADLDEAVELPGVGAAGALCAMRQAAPIVRKPRIQPGGGYAWPSLAEATAFFTGARPIRAADARDEGLRVVHAIRQIHDGILQGGPMA